LNDLLFSANCNLAQATESVRIHQQW